MRLQNKWHITRDAVDDLGYESHRRAAQATLEGNFQREILPIQGIDENGDLMMIDRDQGIRANPNREKMGQLQPVFTSDGVTTAGNSSQISDGAAGVLLMTKARANELGLTPRARVVATATVGSDPHLMLTGPISATKKVLAKAKMTMDNIDIFEVNEAFATVVRMWEQELEPDISKVNVHGGAIALGHPVGCSGARLMTTLLNALETHDKQVGLQTMCCGGGLGTGTIIERLN